MEALEYPLCLSQTFSSIAYSIELLRFLVYQRLA